MAAPGGAAAAAAAWQQLELNTSALGPAGSVASATSTAVAEEGPAALYLGRIFQLFGRYDQDLW